MSLEFLLKPLLKKISKYFKDEDPLRIGKSKIELKFLPVELEKDFHYFIVGHLIIEQVKPKEYYFVYDIDSDNLFEIDEKTYKNLENLIEGQEYFLKKDRFPYIRNLLSKFSEYL